VQPHTAHDGSLTLDSTVFRNSMPDATASPDSIPSTNPVEAYTADLDRLGRSAPFCGSDDAWLMLAHALHRMPLLSGAEAAAAQLQTADAIAVSAIAASKSSNASLLRCAAALRALHDPTLVIASGNSAVTELFVATQSVAEDQELAGAFGLAYATLSSLVAAFGARATPRAQGNALSQIGRAVRQLGAHDLAHGYYDDAMMIGYDGEALDVVARALLGLGSLALTRGNYPKGREMFERALVNAERATDPEFVRLAHHGLFNCAFASGDLDSAMVHGWNVLRLCIAPNSRAEALVNMAEVCRLSGEHDAALRVYSVALEWSSQTRIRAHALGGALHSAAFLQRTGQARRYLSELDDMLPTVADPYTLAVVTMESANALHLMGDRVSANDRLEEALSIAATHSFHELAHRVEKAISSIRDHARTELHENAKLRRTRPPRSDEYKMVLRSLRGLASATI
jgi:tetratricopeptide (TPR) repeat protein